MKKSILIILTIITVISIGLAIFSVYLATKDKPIEENETVTNDTPTEKVEAIFECDNYKYEIPNGLEYTLADSGFDVEGEEWLANVHYSQKEESNESEIEKNDIEELFVFLSENTDKTRIKIDKEKISDLDIVVESYFKENTIIYYFIIHDKYFRITLSHDEETFDYKNIEKIIESIKNAKKINEGEE